jgi:hypothetical protein
VAIFYYLQKAKARFAITPHLPLRGILSRTGRGHASRLFVILQRFLLFVLSLPLLSSPLAGLQRDE